VLIDYHIVHEQQDLEESSGGEVALGRDVHQEIHYSVVQLYGLHCAHEVLSPRVVIASKKLS